VSEASLLPAPPFARIYGEPLIEIPTDLYIPPDALEILLDAFQGPLDLLLYLIRKQNLDVLDIPMAPLTRQYLEYVEMMRATNLELAAEYLVMAAMLIEINPLFVYPDGRWVAGDAKIVTDDNALPRQTALEALVISRSAAYPDVARKNEHGFDYVVVDPEGEIGLLTTGAGLSMMLIDELHAAGLKPYNFLDIRTGGLRGETRRLTQVLKWIGEGQKVRVLLVNIFAGITDLGEFSRLLVEAIAAAPQLKVPVVARLVGNGLPAAREVLAAAGIALHTDLDEALAAVRAHLSQSRNGQD